MQVRSLGCSMSRDARCVSVLIRCSRSWNVWPIQVFQFFFLYNVAGILWPKSMRLTQPTFLMPFGGYMCFCSGGLFWDQLLFAGTLPDYVFRESTQLLLICLLFFPFFFGKKMTDMLIIIGVRRVFIVEAGTKRVEGIISLGDIFRFLLG